MQWTHARTSSLHFVSMIFSSFQYKHTQQHIKPMIEEWTAGVKAIAHIALSTWIPVAFEVGLYASGRQLTDIEVLFQRYC